MLCELMRTTVYWKWLIRVSNTISKKQATSGLKTREVLFDFVQKNKTARSCTKPPLRWKLFCRVQIWSCALVDYSVSCWANVSLRTMRMLCNRQYSLVQHSDVEPLYLSQKHAKSEECLIRRCKVFNTTPQLCTHNKRHWKHITPHQTGIISMQMELSGVYNVIVSLINASILSLIHKRCLMLYPLASLRS